MAGRVGRPALPSNVHYLNGTKPGRTADLLDEFRPDVELPGLPAWVQGEAAAEYERIGQQLVRYGLVSALDRGVLVMMACEWARYVWAEMKIGSENAADTRRGERGLVDTTPNGFKVQSVYLQISRAALGTYMKLASEFGLTPSARSRVKAGAGGQMPLPGMDEDGQGAPTLRSFA